MFNRIINNDNNNNNNHDTRLKGSPSSSNLLRKKDNAGLIRLLKVIEAAGKDGISTRRLCEQAFVTRNYGMRVINRAYEEGFIRRFGKNKHSPKKVNYLSDKGKELLRSQLQQHEEE